jgi:hypothetical protein
VLDRLSSGEGVAMVCEAGPTPEHRQSAAKLSLKFGASNGSQDAQRQHQLLPRSNPREGGERRISIEARSDENRITFDLTAGEAAELMFELGSALEQAARDESRARSRPPRLESLGTGRA